MARATHNLPLGRRPLPSSERGLLHLRLAFRNAHGCEGAIRVSACPFVSPCSTATAAHRDPRLRREIPVAELSCDLWAADRRDGREPLRAASCRTSAMRQCCRWLACSATWPATGANISLTLGVCSFGHQGVHACRSLEGDEVLQLVIAGTTGAVPARLACLIRPCPNAFALLPDPSRVPPRFQTA